MKQKNKTDTYFAGKVECIMAVICMIQLPYELSTIDDLSTLKNKLKTYYFGKAHDLQSLVTRYDYKV